ncbi:MAG TPA: fructose PTS transporter subunit IIB [Symbiobacteriaceae bacterium]|nr:fructose PTS transporter subunit IIB [Symbiobacteriaceae bacterium]
MNIVAVTACPAGLAHTYMAAEAIRKAAIRLGHTIKVETQGSMGLRNELTPAEIAAADLIIFAVDMAVAKVDRFKDRKIFTCNPAQAVRDATGVVTAALKSVQ